MSTIFNDDLDGPAELVVDLLPLESFVWNDIGIGQRL